MGDWPDAGGLITYKIVNRSDVTFGGKDYRRRNPGRVTALAASIEEDGLLMPPAVIEAGTTPGTAGMETVCGRKYVLIGGERRFMALGKGSTTPAAIITTWPQFIAWLDLDKAVTDSLLGKGVVRLPAAAERNRFRSRALTFLGDRRPWTRKAREAIADYFGTNADEMRCYYALTECAAGRTAPDRVELARVALEQVNDGLITAAGGLSRVSREAARLAFNGKPGKEQRDTVAAALVQMEVAARALDELGEISPDFPPEDLAALGARLAKVRAKITRASRSMRSEGAER